MASLSVAIAANGPTSGVNGFKGVCDVGVHRANGAKSNIFLEVSYDGGTTYHPMVGGWFGNTELDTSIVAGDSTVFYRFNARSVSGGTTNVYLGND